MEFPSNNQLNLSSSNLKRSDYLSWDEFFVSTLLLTAKRCDKTINKRLAALLINDRNILIGLGYTKTSNGNEIHAELDAIRNVCNYEVEDSILYTISFPCEHCAEAIINNRIIEVVYLADDTREEDRTDLSRILFDSIDVKYRQFIPKCKKIEIDFESIDQKELLQSP